jgi:hypothetical protein
MKLYQVYRWDHTDGPTVRFYANKAEATRAAKTFVKETDNDGEIEVSVFELYTKKVGLIFALNCIAATVRTTAPHWLHRMNQRKYLPPSLKTSITIEVSDAAGFY